MFAEFTILFEPATCRLNARSTTKIISDFRFAFYCLLAALSHDFLDTNLKENASDRIQITTRPPRTDVGG